MTAPPTASMIAMWRYVEADFRRDYGIRLCDALHEMSWREFQVLLTGLSPWGAVAGHHEEVMKCERLRAQREDAGSARESTAAFWAQVTAVRPPK